MLQMEHNFDIVSFKYIYKHFINITILLNRSYIPSMLDFIDLKKHLSPFLSVLYSSSFIRLLSSSDLS